MSTATEKRHDAAFLLHEANGDLSRENVTLLSGQNLKAGAVLGKITASGKYKEFNPDAGDGAETAAAILLIDSDASAGDKQVAVIDCLAEVLSALLLWGSGVDTGEKTTALASLRTKFVKAR